MARTTETVSTRLGQIAARSRNAPGMVFTNLAHHLDVELLQEAFHRTRRTGAPGVDGVTWADYGAHLDENLQALHERLRAGRYRAPPVRRVHIPKGRGNETRPLGIPTLEDKVVQQAAKMVLEAVYEPVFHDCSYGFRPGRSAHQALHVVWDGLMRMRGGWILDVDIKGFFDNLDHAHLRAILDQKVRDKGVRRLIGKWLNAGVLEGDVLRPPVSGTPQGGVISPLLANIYLDTVIDQWFHREVVPRMRGESFMVRYADDLVMVFTSKQDALRVLSVLEKRLARFGLSIHPDKTRLVRFERPPRGESHYPDGEPRETFDFLGFTHYWAMSRSNTSVVKRKTASNRLSRSLRAIRQWCRANRHRPVTEQQEILSRKVMGFYAYYGIRGNYAALAQFYRQVLRAWRKWLDRRSDNAHMGWKRFNEFLQRHALPTPRIVHTT